MTVKTVAPEDRSVFGLFTSHQVVIFRSENRVQYGGKRTSVRVPSADSISSAESVSSGACCTHTCVGLITMCVRCSPSTESNDRASDSPFWVASRDATEKQRLALDLRAADVAAHDLDGDELHIHDRG